LGWFWQRDERGQLVLHDGVPKIDFSRVSEEQLRCLAEFTVEKDGRVKLKAHDPMTALDRLARTKGMFRDKVALTDPTGTAGVTPMIVQIVRFSDLPAPEREKREHFPQLPPAARKDP
jgi:hypothetical protein